MPFCCFQIDKKTTEIFVTISVVDSKKRLNQKKINTPYFFDYLFENYLIRGLFFDLNSIWKLGQESLENLGFFGGETPKGHFEIN